MSGLDGGAAAYSAVLELAAGDDAEGLMAVIDRDPAAADRAFLWYSRRPGSSQMSPHLRTPLMVAAAYGSLDALSLLLRRLPSPHSVNRQLAPDSATALHCAASGGAPAAPAAVKLLLSAGADPALLDSAARRPADVITGPKAPLLELLGDARDARDVSPPLSSSPDGSGSPSSKDSVLEVREKREYPVDPTLPDLKNSVYATDEFRMYVFKVRPCSRAYSHDWTECPFVHPGENARRRDPRKYSYSCAPCPEFRKGACARGDACDYAHGVFESWLHPAQYRTRLCKDGPGCDRRVCFFAHAPEELRAVYGAGGVASSPRSSRALEMAMMSLLPGSPNSAMSPSGGVNWPQPNVPMLHLPGSNHQSSRLRSSLNARDILAVDDSSLILDLDDQFNSAQAHFARSKSMNPSNLEGMFSAEICSSPRYCAGAGAGAGADQGAMFSPSHKAAVFNQLQQQQSVLSPINTRVFSPKIMDPLQHHSMLQVPSPGRMSPRNVDQLSPLSAKLAVFAQREKLQQQHQLRSLSSRDLSSGMGSPVSHSLSKWGSPTGKLEWGVNGDELDQLKRAATFDLGSGGNDVSWVHPLAGTPEKGEKPAACGAIGAGRPGSNPNTMAEGHAVIDAWLEQMQLDQASEK